MQAGRETDDFIFVAEHIGFEADFYHKLRKKLALSEKVISAFEAEKDDAEIFIQRPSNTCFSSDEILSWFLLQTGTTIANHLPKDAMERGSGDVFVTFPIRFNEGVFYMDTVEGKTDLALLHLLVKVSIVAKTEDHTGQ